MPDSLASELLRVGAQFWIVWVVFVALVFSVVWPILAWSLVANVRRIRLELQQLNDTLREPSRRL